MDLAIPWQTRETVAFAARSEAQGAPPVCREHPSPAPCNHGGPSSGPTTEPAARAGKLQ